MMCSHAIVAHWDGEFDERALQHWAEQVRVRLDAPRVSLGLVFIAPKLFAQASMVLEILRVHAQIPLLIGCSSASLIVGPEELEEGAGLVLGLYSLPGAELRAFRFTQQQVDEANGPTYWHVETGVLPDQTHGWLVFADPFHLDAERWLSGWNEAYPGLPVVGGLASGEQQTPGSQVYLNGDVFEDGGVALSVGGQVWMAGVVSQGCTPIGETWTITRAEKNVIQEIGNRPAHDVLMETYSRLSEDEQTRTRGNLFVGLVVNEYLDEFQRGDFLIRNLVGWDPRTKSLVIGAWPRPGQTLQFQRRDPAAATSDLTGLLDRSRRELAGIPVYGGCLCCCNGRGVGMFGRANHDASLVQHHLGPLGVSGFFCNGEIGPVGDRNFLHGYTAALALFVGGPPPGSQAGGDAEASRPA